MMLGVERLTDALMRVGDENVRPRPIRITYGTVQCMLLRLLFSLPRRVRRVLQIRKQNSPSLKV